MTGCVDFEESEVARRDALLRTGVATPAPPTPTVEAPTTPSFVDLMTGTTTPIGGSLEGGSVVPIRSGIRARTTMLARVPPAAEIGRLVFEPGFRWSVSQSVGCSQNSLTTRMPALPEDLPQVKRGASHNRSGPAKTTGAAGG